MAVFLLVFLASTLLVISCDNTSPPGSVSSALPRGCKSQVLPLNTPLQTLRMRHNSTDNDGIEEHMMAWSLPRPVVPALAVQNAGLCAHRGGPEYASACGLGQRRWKRSEQFRRGEPQHPVRRAIANLTPNIYSVSTEWSDSLFGWLHYVLDKESVPQTMRLYENGQVERARCECYLDIYTVELVTLR
ncbi:hypothetical protein EDB89DRAFT_2245342 [Lactarius sanguifluus]|nr:hypothetical protein EDB89DRAFT_2245342 [Lactarius sanguifluus]